MPQISEKRRAPRKPLHHKGLIASREAGLLRECMLADVSDAGARISVHGADEIPDEFTLVLTRNAKTRRECRVVWRRGEQIGVHFTRTHR